MQSSPTPAIAAEARGVGATPLFSMGKVKGPSRAEQKQTIVMYLSILAANKKDPDAAAANKEELDSAASLQVQCTRVMATCLAFQTPRRAFHLRNEKAKLHVEREDGVLLLWEKGEANVLPPPLREEWEDGKGNKVEIRRRGALETHQTEVLTLPFLDNAVRAFC